jgi:hypothetical protein
MPHVLHKPLLNSTRGCFIALALMLYKVLKPGTDNLQARNETLCPRPPGWPHW